MRRSLRDARAAARYGFVAVRRAIYGRMECSSCWRLPLFIRRVRNVGTL